MGTEGRKPKPARKPAEAKCAGQTAPLSNGEDREGQSEAEMGGMAKRKDVRGELAWQDRV